MNSVCRLLALSLPFLLPSCEKEQRQGIGGSEPKALKVDRSEAGQRVSSRGQGRLEEPVVTPATPAVPKEKIEEKAGKLCETDPAAALQWANGLSDAAEREAALEAIAWRTTLDDLPVAVEALESLPAGMARNRLAAHLVAEWATREPESALEWAKKRGEESERDEALCGWVVATGELSPERAGTLAADEISPGPVQNRAVVSVLQRWAPKDYRAAAVWVAAFPEGSLKNDAQQALDAVAK